MKLNLYILLFSATFVFACSQQKDGGLRPEDNPFSITGSQSLESCNKNASAFIERDEKALANEIYNLTSPYIASEAQKDEEIFKVYDSLKVVVDYEAIVVDDKLKDSLCSLEVSLAGINLREANAANLIHIYNLLVLQTIVQNYSEINGVDGKVVYEDGASILNIRLKGDSIYSDFKWDFLDGRFSLDEVENEIVSQIGPIGHLMLIRGAKQFPGFLSEQVTPENINELANNVAENLVNNDFDLHTIFEFPSSDKKGLIIPNEIVAIVFEKNFTAEFGSVREFYSEFVIEGPFTPSKEQLLERDDKGEFLWEVGAVDLIDFSLNNAPVFSSKEEE